MPQMDSWREHLIQAQTARSRAFNEYLTLLRGQEFSSELPLQLIAFFDSVNDGILDRLNSLSSDLDFQSLSDGAAEVHLVRYSVLYQFLFKITADLEHVETSRTIVEFSGPLHRMVIPQFGDVRLVLHALPEINYSWTDLVTPLRAIARELDIPIAKDPPARQVWSLGFPGLQSGQTLMHALLCHEVGHGVVQSTSLVRSLRRRVKIDNKQIDAILASAPEILPRQALRRPLRRYINAVLTDWLEELACDVIGYELVGPAFLLASIHFLPVLSELDSSSAGYPSVRLRLSLLFKLLKADLRCNTNEVCDHAAYKEAFFEDRTASFLKEWDERISADAGPHSDDPIAIFSEAIERSFQDLLIIIRKKRRGLKLTTSSLTRSILSNFCSVSF